MDTKKEINTKQFSLLDYVAEAEFKFRDIEDDLCMTQIALEDAEGKSDEAYDMILTYRDKLEADIKELQEKLPDFYRLGSLREGYYLVQGEKNV